MYSRQRAVPQIGQEGQRRLSEAVVTLVGAGGLGCPAAIYLTYAGVGHIRMIDGDGVSLSNLNRQILYKASDLGKKKAKMAAEILGAVHPGQTVEGIEAFVDPENAGSLIAGSHVVVDCVDDQKTRRLLNRACASLGIPLVEAGIHGFYGYVMSIGPEGPCLECLGYEKEETSKVIPSLGATAGIIGSLQASECIKIITGAGSPLYGRMLTYDGLDGSFDVIPVCISKDCPIHGCKR